MIIQEQLKDKDFLKRWIEQRADAENKYITLERQIFAFYLLEQLIETNVEFIFKGGTSLILLLEQTKRFSTDIDILISKPNLEQLEKLFNIFVHSDAVFTSYEEDVREDSKFPKKHFKFYFNSLYKNEDQEGYILLDAVFEDNPYKKLVQKPIKNDVLFTETPYKEVRMPSITDIMIDKLTAFAPRTVGVRFFRTKENGEQKDHTREVAKQWFDVNELFKKCDDFTQLNIRYIKLSTFEIEQRGLINVDYKDCLKDSFECALEYLNNGNTNKELNDNLKKGIRKLDSFVNADIDGNHFVEASVNVIELISRVFCDNPITYSELLVTSKTEIPYELFIKQKKIKVAVQKVKINKQSDRDRFIESLRVINTYIDF